MDGQMDGLLNGKTEGLTGPLIEMIRSAQKPQKVLSIRGLMPEGQIFPPQTPIITHKHAQGRYSPPAVSIPNFWEWISSNK